MSTAPLHKAVNWFAIANSFIPVTVYNEAQTPAVTAIHRTPSQFAFRQTASAALPQQKHQNACT